MISNPSYLPDTMPALLILLARIPQCQRQKDKSKRLKQRQYLLTWLKTQGIPVQLDANKVVIPLLPLFQVTSAWLCADLPYRWAFHRVPATCDLHPSSSSREGKGPLLPKSCSRSPSYGSHWPCLGHYRKMDRRSNSMDLHRLSLGLRDAKKTERQKVFAKKGGMNAEQTKARATYQGPHNFVSKMVFLVVGMKGQDGYVIWLRSHAKRWQSWDSSPRFPVLVLCLLLCFFDRTDLPVPVGWADWPPVPLIPTPQPRCSRAEMQLPSEGPDHMAGSSHTFGQQKSGRWYLIKFFQSKPLCVIFWG